MTTREGECSVCGGAASAVWHGSEVVRVCRDCARGVLPALMADAVFLPAHESYRLHHCDHFWRESAAAFWRAVACRVEADRRKRVEDEVARP